MYTWSMIGKVIKGAFTLKLHVVKKPLDDQLSWILPVISQAISL